ncbi:MAG: methionyl-tRNA formyltransferase, partial [Patescibacteria group bacterium]
MKLAFFGTPRFSCFVLDALDAAGYTPALIITTPDRPAGRGLELQMSPVKQWAITHNVDVIQPTSLKGDALDADVKASPLLNTEWDLFVVAGYGKILPKRIVDLPKYGSLNVHPSLLPRFRGPSPIESQTLQDEKEVGVSILVMDEKMDHGPILAQARITPEEWPLRTRELEDMLWSEGGDLLGESIPAYADGSLVPEPQDHSAATTTSF